MPSPNSPVRNPLDDSFCFGQIPECKSGRDQIPAGPIQLRQGRHKGVNNGFGLEHIWAEHSQEMRQAGFKTKDEVPDFVATIIRSGSEIFYEGGNYKKTRITVIRSRAGIAVLEQRYTGNNEIIWSVVTAYASTKRNGTRLGTVL